MRSRTTRVAVGLLVGASLGLGAFVSTATAPAASAAPGSCAIAGAEEWTPIFDDVCELVVFANRTVQIPTGAEQLEAVLVGAGGGSYYDAGARFGAAGGGGGVTASVYPGALPVTARVILDVEVGAGGAPGQAGGRSGISGGWTSARAEGGGAGLIASGRFIGGARGGGEPGPSPFAVFGWGESVSGGGARTAGAYRSPGLGFQSMSELRAAFPVLDPMLWSDAGASNAVLQDGIGRGGEGVPMGPQWSGPGSGAGGSAAQAGTDGLVILRITGTADDPDPNTDPDPDPDPSTTPDPDPNPDPNTDPDPNTNPHPDPNANLDPEPLAPVIDLSGGSVSQNGELVITARGLNPGESVSAAVHSDPFPLGTRTAVGGVASWVFKVPANFPAGQHTVVITRADGSTFTAEITVTAALAETGAAPESGMLWAAAGALVAAGLLVLRARRRVARI